MGLFDDLCFRLIPSAEFPEEEVEEIRDLIEENGGREIDLQLSKETETANSNPNRSETSAVFEASPANLKYAKGPIVVSAHINFPEYAYLADYYISLVQPQWIRQSLIEGRLVPMKPFSPDPIHIFSSCFISVSPWLSDSDRDTIYGAVAALGGLFSDEIAPTTTHYITFNDEHDAKAQMIRATPELANKVKIVLPHWVDDCIKLRRRIQEYAYQFPDPPLLKKQFFEDSPESREQRRKTGLYLSDHHVKPDIPDDCDIFRDRKVFLGHDLDLTSRAKSTLIDLITACQGEVVNKLSDANVYIGQFRDGEQYLEAFDNHMYIGNVTWLYWMIANEKWSSPLARLLHYPLPRYGVPKMKHYVISLSNYHDNARIYLEKLIAACGATYTKDLSHRNTHLIAASPKGTKFIAARKWGIHVVNHIWLEESYATWQAADISLPRFSYIADRLDLNNLIGKTVLVRESLKEQRVLEDGIALNDQGVVDDSQELPSKFFATPVAQRQKETGTEEAMADESHVDSTIITSTPLVDRTTDETHSSANGTSNGTTKEAEQEAEQEDNDHDDDQTNEHEGSVAKKRKTNNGTAQPPDASESTTTTADPDAPVQHETIKGNGKGSRKGRGAASRQTKPTASDKTPAATSTKGPKKGRSTKAKRERTSSRDAGAVAANEDEEEEEEEEEGGGGGGGGGGEEEDNDEEEEEEEQETNAKTIKKRSRAPKNASKSLSPGSERFASKKDKIHVLLTGFEKDDIERQHAALAQLNVEITDDPDECQLLVAPKILRTEKFLRSLATAEYIVVPRYLQKSLAAGKLEWPPPKKFFINDALVEDIMENSRKLGKKGLLEDFVICYMGPLRVNYGTFKRIVYSHGCPLTISGSFTSAATREKLKSLNPENVLFVTTKEEEETFDLLEYIVNLGIDSNAVMVDLDWVFDSILRMALYLK